MIEFSSDGSLTETGGGETGRTVYFLDQYEPILVIDRTAEYDPEAVFDDEYDIYMVEVGSDGGLVLYDINYGGVTEESRYYNLYLEGYSTITRGIEAGRIADDRPVGCRGSHAYGSFRHR